MSRLVNFVKHMHNQPPLGEHDTTAVVGGSSGSAYGTDGQDLFEQLMEQNITS
jgi:hypothetical protein